MLNSMQDVENVLRPVVESMGYIFWGCTYHAHGHLVELCVYIDKDGGVASDDCNNVAKQIRAILAVEESLGRTYQLTVSSPGINRPLFGLEQWEQFIGHVVKVQLQKPIGNRRNFEGVIAHVGDADVQLKVGEEMVHFPLNMITKANLHEEVAI